MRLFVENLNRAVLKIDFLRDKLAEPPVRKKGIYLNTLTNITVNKITAFRDGVKAKDVIDLFYLVRKGGMSVKGILTLADKRRAPVPYEKLLTIGVIGIGDSALLTKPVDYGELENFIEELRSAVSQYLNEKLSRAREGAEAIVRMLLWDFPHKDRNLNPYSIPVLERRIVKLPYPERMTVRELIEKYKERR
ncbi:hypothetical protein [Thermovibrio sp.]